MILGIAFLFILTPHIHCQTLPYSHLGTKNHEEVFGTYYSSNLIDNFLEEDGGSYRVFKSTQFKLETGLEAPPVSDPVSGGIRIKRRTGVRYRRRDDISLWIDEEQVRRFSGYPMEIYAIVDGTVMPFLLEPDFEDQLPIIPSDVSTFNFTWKAGRRKYFYHFDILSSFDRKILRDPYISIKKKGRVPKKPKVFSVHLPCDGRISGEVSFSIGLVIRDSHGSYLPHTPLRLHLRKKCDHIDGGNACDEKCSNGGFCDQQKRCQCPEGYMGLHCDTALCYPKCRNEGFCSAPGRCSCPRGYHGRFCEGGICTNKCLNGGKCIQKDVCSCRKGYYGSLCEFSKCVIPCINGGTCRGMNTCRCKKGYSGDHCEIITSSGLTFLLNRCNTKCRHGKCVNNGSCQCKKSFSGRWCRKKIRKKANASRKHKLWV